MYFGKATVFLFVKKKNLNKSYQHFVLVKAASIVILFLHKVVRQNTKIRKKDCQISHCSRKHAYS